MSVDRQELTVALIHFELVAMAKFYDKTNMGGEREVFQTTRWSEIGQTQTANEKLQREIIGKLIKKYWKPVYAHLRRKGYTNEPAKDLTQGFFSEIVLGRDLIQQADQTKGRFRTFLLTALDRYVTDIQRKETAIKRSPVGQSIISGIDELPEISETEVAPDQAFDYAWASELLDDVLTRLKAWCYRTGKEPHWEVFRARVLKPIFDTEEAVSMTDICKKYRIENEVKASNMIVTIKRRFHTVLRQSLRRYVHSDADVEEELGEILKILSKNSAR